MDFDLTNKIIEIPDFPQLDDNDINKIILKQEIRYERELLEFAIENKAKEIYVSRYNYVKDNMYTLNYRFFNKKLLAKEFAKANNTDYQILNFSKFISMPDDEFENLISSRPNADLARKYRKTLLENEISKQTK